MTIDDETQQAIMWYIIAIFAGLLILALVSDCTVSVHIKVDQTATQTPAPK